MEILIDPFSVNLRELLSKLKRIWVKRLGSRKTSSGTFFLISIIKSRPFSFLSSSIMETTSVTSERISTVSLYRGNMPFSRREMSSRSLIIEWRISDDNLAFCINSACFLFSFVLSKRLRAPFTPVRGVRMSWLMFAKNSVLDRLAFSAKSMALISFACWLSISFIKKPKFLAMSVISSSPSTLMGRRSPLTRSKIWLLKLIRRRTKLSLK